MPRNPWDDDSPESRESVRSILETSAVGFPARDPSSELRELRRFLAYSLIHCYRYDRGIRETLNRLARDPLVGPGHPAYVVVADSLDRKWKLHPYLVEAALGNAIRPGETIDSAMARLYRMMTEGG